MHHSQWVPILLEPGFQGCLGVFLRGLGLHDGVTRRNRADSTRDVPGCLFDAGDTHGHTGWPQMHHARFIPIPYEPMLAPGVGKECTASQLSITNLQRGVSFRWETMAFRLFIYLV